MALLVLQQGRKKRSNIAFSVLAFAVGGWVLGIAAFLLTDDASLAMIWARVYYFFPLLIGTSMLMLAYFFPDKKKMPPLLFTVVLGGFFALALPIVFDPNFLSKHIVYHDWGKEVVLNKFPYMAYSLFVVLTFLESLRMFYLNSRKLVGLYKAQAKLLFVGIFISAIFGVLFNLILPGVGNYQLIHLGPLATNFFLITIAYSIIRYKMFDVKLIIVRSVAYALSLFVVAVAYGSVSYILSTAAFTTIQNSAIESIVNIGLLVVVAITFAPLKRTFDRVTNTFFYRDAYDPQLFINQLNRIVVTNVDVQQLLEQSAKVIDMHLKAGYCIFSLQDNQTTRGRIVGDNSKVVKMREIEKLVDLAIDVDEHVIVADSLENRPALLSYMRSNDMAVVAKLATSTKFGTSGVGFLILGQKKSGNPYSKQDIGIIEIIANELVIAIENALRFEEIENFNVTLQEKVNDATKRLKNANEKLTAMDETKDEFISMASHQLRTPLTSVKGYVSMVLEGDAGELNDMQRKLLEQSFASSQRMVFLIADLLNLSRLRTGKFIVDAVPTNLAEVIQSEVEQLTETAASRNLKLTYEKPTEFPTLMLDETKIRQVIMNFVDNAIYYTPAGGSISIHLKETPKSVEFTVVDDGIGVPKAEQHHLFNKFYRARNAQKARPDGTGLGLFMAKKVIVAQGGALVFNSKEGKGSTFGFTFAKARLLPPTTDHKAQTTSRVK